MTLYIGTVWIMSCSNKAFNLTQFRPKNGHMGSNWARSCTIFISTLGNIVLCFNWLSTEFILDPILLFDIFCQNTIIHSSSELWRNVVALAAIMVYFRNHVVIVNRIFSFRVQYKQSRHLNPCRQWNRNKTRKVPGCWPVLVSFTGFGLPNFLCVKEMRMRWKCMNISLLIEAHRRWTK